MSPARSRRWVVQKYGGTSVGSPAKIRRVAERVAAIAAETGVVVVVSAMGDTTDRLVKLASRITRDAPAREMDSLLSAGETITAPLMAMALQALGVPALSLSGAQAGIRTSHSHTRARILDVVPTRVIRELEKGMTVVVAGFQGVNKTLDVTTLGRGGSDTTAVALAAALKADECEINTDVPGILTADPRVVPEARLLPAISYDEMLELSSLGAKVMHPRAVEIGELYDIPIRVRGTFDGGAGTLITRSPEVEERNRVRGIASEEDVAKLTLVGVPDKPGIAARIFTPLADKGSQSGQGLHRRHRDAGPAGHRRADVQDAGRRRDQHRHDFDQRDPDHLHRGSRARQRRGSGAPQGVPARPGVRRGGTPADA